MYYGDQENTYIDKKEAQKIWEYLHENRENLYIFRKDTNLLSIEFFIEYLKKEFVHKKITKLKQGDRELGIELYEYLEAKGLRAFFSAITLEKHGIDKWDDAIDEALKSAKVFVAIGSQKKYMNSEWV